MKLSAHQKFVLELRAPIECRTGGKQKKSRRTGPLEKDTLEALLKQEFDELFSEED